MLRGRLLETPDRDSVAPLELADEELRLVREVKNYAIYMLDAQGVVRTWNEGARAIKGYTADEIVGQHFSKFFTPEDRAAGRPERLLHVARTLGHAEDQDWRLRKNGSRFWADVVITAVHDKDKRLQGFVKVTRDMTDRRHAEELLRQSEERLRLLIEGVKDYAIFMLDPEGNILSWNAGAERIKGYRADEVVGRHFSIFYPRELRELGHPELELRIAQQEGRYEEEGIRVRKDGERFWANVVITAVFEPGTDKLRGFAKVTRDLTERRQAEAAMRAAAEEISRERLRTEEAQRALKERDAFISVAAHELRTPLAALMLKVQGAQALALKQVNEQGTALPKFSDRLAGALRQISRLSDLVQRLLDVSSIVSGKLAMRFESASMVALLQAAVDEFRDAADAAGCTLTLISSGPAEGEWDAARVEQVINNLIANALKYGCGKPIEIRVEEDEATVTVIVQDRGIGIATPDLDRIFGRFERAASLDHYGGLGLGLYIAKSVVDAHGGSLRAESSPGQGATFTMTLPRRPPTREAQPPAQAQQESL
jgi:PAS domain S-box-containing protein